MGGEDSNTACLLTGGNSAVQIHQLSKWRTQVSKVVLCVGTLDLTSRGMHYHGVYVCAYVSVRLCVCMCITNTIYVHWLYCSKESLPEVQRADSEGCISPI